MAGNQDAQGVQLGRWVREKRQSLGMDQATVWARMEIEGDPNWLSLLESGRRKSLPDTDYLIALSAALRSSMTDVLRGAGILPVDVEERPEIAPGSATIHALVDMVDWVREPHYRDATEAFLRGILEQQKTSAERGMAGSRGR